jgi:hypothetical protein
VGSIGLIFVDTLSAVIPGSNENDAGEMSLVLSHCMRLHTMTGATVVLVHHVGKTDGKGMRGSSVFGGNLEFTIEITRANENRTATVRKMKEGEDGQQFGFRLERQLLGKDAEGDDVSSCYVVHGAAVKGGARKGKSLTEIESRLLEALEKLLGARRDGSWPENDDVVAEAVKNAPPSKVKRDERPKTYKVALGRLVTAGKVISKNGTVGFPEQPE